MADAAAASDCPWTWTWAWMARRGCSGASDSADSDAAPRLACVAERASLGMDSAATAAANFERRAANAYSTDQRSSAELDARHGISNQTPYVHEV